MYTFHSFCKTVIRFAATNTYEEHPITICGQTVNDRVSNPQDFTASAQRNGGAFAWGIPTVMDRIQAAWGVTEELSRTCPMEWVQRCNNIHNRAEEIVFHGISDTVQLRIVSFFTHWYYSVIFENVIPILLILFR